MKKHFNDVIEHLDCMKKGIKKSWIHRLLDMNDESVSSTSVFLFIITFIGLLLLIVPAVILCVELYYNHTVLTDMSAIASYITAVATLFASGGITKAWSNYSNYKYKAKKYGHANLLNTKEPHDSSDNYDVDDEKIHLDINEEL